MPTPRQLLTAAILILASILYYRCSPGGESVWLITEESLDLSSQHGLEKMEAALRAKGYQVKKSNVPTKDAKALQIFIGLSTEAGSVQNRLKERQINAPTGPESLVIDKDQSALLLCGSDGTGLMYALLEAAERIGWKQENEHLFHHIQNTVESPKVQERAVSIYTMHRQSWEERLYDETYWKKYFDQLAHSRINSFVVIFGYENGGFLAPAYPYFFDVEGFPDVKMIGITPEEQQRNTVAFKRMIALAHERGIRFTPGIWDHIYRGGVQSGGVPGMADVPAEPVAGLVWGLDAGNLAAYTKAALKKFMDVFPEIDGIQFRMHWESGLTREETPRFWGEVFDLLQQEKPNLKIDLRTKDLPDEVIQDAIAKKLNFRLTTKYWMEQMGLPFHPVHINTQNQHDRRHGYADLLTYPQNYKLHWRLWNGGTARILLWGDPEYVRRFVESTRVYNGNSFEVNEPLATKMEAQPHDMAAFPLLNPAYQYYEYEFERYWYFFQLWGRLAYNPDLEPDIFVREFTRRFGAESGQNLRQGLHMASRVLPRIIAATYHYRFFPTTRGWAEKMRMEALPQFARAEGSDIQLFANFTEEAELLLKGEDSPKTRPSATARWFTAMADSILTYAEKAEAVNQDPSNKEFLSTAADLKILAYLSQYYGRRIPAAVSYNLWEKTGDLSMLDLAIQQERHAITAWENLVTSAADIYTDNLRMGICHGGMCGHWREELEHLGAGVKALEQVRDSISRDLAGKDLQVYHTAVAQVSAGTPFSIRAAVLGGGETSIARCAVRQGNGTYQRFDLHKTKDHQYEVSISPESGTESLVYFLEVETLAGQKFTYPVTGEKKPIVLNVRQENDPPVVEILPTAPIRPGESLRVEAKANDPSGIRWVQLRYRHLTQIENYQALPMTYDPKKGIYAAEIPGAFVIPKWDLMFFVEAMDTQGNGGMYPDFEREAPYVVVSLIRK